MRSSSSSRTPEWPRPSETRREATIAADSASSKSRPVPTPWKRSRFSGIWSRSAAGMWLSTDAPTPVVTP